MKRNLQYAVVLAILATTIFLITWLPNTKALSAAVYEVPSLAVGDYQIFLPTLVRDSCIPAPGQKIRFDEVTTGSIDTPGETDDFYFCASQGGCRSPGHQPDQRQLQPLV